MSRWVRVSKKDRCKICDHSDWCDYSPEIGLALCMRIESDRPSKNSMGGWLHKIGEPVKYFRSPKIIVETPRPDFQSMWRRWFDETDHYYLDGFAMSLSVDTDSLSSLGCVWSGRAWAFPMKDAEGKIIGIRLRDNQGNKWAVKGSKQGLFIPEVETQRTLYIVEGVTDAAAALTLGLYAIGRPSCMGCEEITRNFIRNKKVNRAIIVKDNDAPGLKGGAKLQNTLPVLNCSWNPPTKDLRDFISLGGDRATIEAAIKDLCWARP